MSLICSLQASLLSNFHGGIAILFILELSLSFGLCPKIVAGKYPWPPFGLLICLHIHCKTVSGPVSHYSSPRPPPAQEFCLVFLMPHWSCGDPVSTLYQYVLVQLPIVVSAPMLRSMDEYMTSTLEGKGTNLVSKIHCN